MNRIKKYDKTLNHLKKATSLLITVAAIFVAIAYSKECSQGIKNGLTFCFSVLIPSLFIFMIVAQYTANSKISTIIGIILQKPSQKILGLSGVCSGVLILSLIGGYPVGARCIASLYKNRSISKGTASKLSMMAVCSGPGFVLNFVGQAMLSNKSAGAILFASQVTSFIVLCFICSKVMKCDDTGAIIVPTKKYKTFVESVNDGCVATINMCAMVLLFSAIIAVCDCIFKDNKSLSDLLCATLEVTTACKRLCTKAPLYVTSFIIGFGGICVHCQVFSALKDIGINKTLFFLFRILQGILAACTTYILLILINPHIEVFSTTKTVYYDNASTIWGSVALILTAICFVNSVKLSKHIRR